MIDWVQFELFRIGQTTVTLSSLLGAVIIFVVAMLLSMLMQRLLGRYLQRQALLNAGMIYAIQRLLHYTIIFVGIVLAAQSVGLNLRSIVFALGFLGVGIGLGLQNITSNFVSGLILLFERPISVGDHVTIQQPDGVLQGIVSRINMRSTLVKTYDNLAIIVPNSKFVENDVINWSYGDTRVRLHIPVGVAYGSDLDFVTEVLMKVADDNPDLLKKPEPIVYWLEFGNSSINCELIVWTNKLDSRLIIKSNLMRAVDRAFKANNVRIPFPQRDLHLQMSPAVDKLAGSTVRG